MKRHEKPELEKIIEASEIFKAIERLELALKFYARYEPLKRYRYMVILEVNALYRKSEELKSQLEEMTKESRKWEKLE